MKTFSILTLALCLVGCRNDESELRKAFDGMEHAALKSQAIAVEAQRIAKRYAAEYDEYRKQARHTDDLLWGFLRDCGTNGQTLTTNGIVYRLEKWDGYLAISTTNWGTFK
jgi:hypothetical protein